jgi:manganese/iron transport system permease protein
MMGWSVFAAIISAVGGVYLSFWLDTDAAPTIILLLTLLFILALVGKRLFGWRHKADG